MSNKAPARPIRVLIVDDSAFVRKVLSETVRAEEGLEVVGAARDGAEGLELAERLRPDVITLDLMMPGLDGLAFLKRQLARRAVPVVVVSVAEQTGDLVLRALDAGAVDFVHKPTALASERLREMGAELLSKIRAAAAAKVRAPLAPARPPAEPALGRAACDIVVVGVSTGGPQALKVVIPGLAADFPVPVAVVMHMPEGYTAMYAEKLAELSALAVTEASDGDAVLAGKALIAPAGRHMTFVRGPAGGVSVHLDRRPLDTLHRPSVDVLFQSAAEVYGARTLGVVMTGMGSDGLKGCGWIKAQGGRVITEDESTCVVYGMPRSVAEASLSDQAVPLDKMHAAIARVVGGTHG